MKSLVDKIKDEKVNVNIEEFLFDQEFKDTIIKAIKSNERQKEFSKDEIDETFQKIEEKHFKLKEKIDKISIDTNGIRVILTVDGEDLIYENGEYYIFDTITKTKKRKLTKNQARELYIEYFIRYQLNPILENKKMKKMVKDISLKTRQQKETIAIEQAKTEKQKEEIKSKEKLIKKEAKTIDKKSKSKDIER